MVATSLPSQFGLRLPAFAQEGRDQKVGRAFIRCDVSTQGLVPCDWAAMWPSRAHGRLLSMNLTSFSLSWPWQADSGELTLVGMLTLAVVCPTDQDPICRLRRTICLCPNLE